MAQINFGGVEEKVVTREEFPLEKAREVLRDETIAVIGYGVQGPGQSLNLKDNGFNVIVGQREGSKSWDKAVADGWVPGKTLFGIEEAARRATIIQYLLSDAGQIAVWPTIEKHLAPGKALYFSHGFGITYKERTGIVPPAGVDVILIAPKGSGTSLRRMFLQGRGLNSSYAVFQDATGRAFERVVALGIGVGSGYLFETDFKREVYSDLTGERGTLMGAIQGIFAAQYDTLRAHGHTPSEAFNETVEELTQSLMPLVAENGMDWMYANCSTTAQRGALDWWKRFRDATKPVFEELYGEVAAGNDKLMERIGVPAEPCRQVGTVIHVAVDGQYAGHILIADVVKPTAKAAIQALKAAGVEKTVMLTGDRDQVAQQVAGALGVDQVYSQLLPADKVEKVEQLLEEKPPKKKLAFVGDGINDAPVLSRADIGIAMGAMGSDAAIEAADVVLMDDDPMQIPKAIKISRKCLGIVYQNIVFAIGVKGVCLVLGALGIANMWLAIFADVGVMILAVLNAIRALFVKNL